MSENLKTVAIIQARMGSTRLPRKVLMDLCGRSMLGRVVDRIRQCSRVDQVAIATTDAVVDRELVDYCEQQNWFCVAGSEHDVLDRYFQAANEYQASRIVRITSDCPLIDPEVVDQVIEKLEQDQALDYACNFYPQRRFPRGLDCEAFTYDTLRRVHRGATDPSHREHVTLKIYSEPEDYNIGSVLCENDLSLLRWTVDTKEDLRLIREIYSHFNRETNASQPNQGSAFTARTHGKTTNTKQPTNFGWRDVLKAYPLNPQWLNLNGNIVQKAA